VKSILGWNGQDSDQSVTVAGTLFAVHAAFCGENNLNGQDCDNVEEVDSDGKDSAEEDSAEEDSDEEEEKDDLIIQDSEEDEEDDQDEAEALVQIRVVSVLWSERFDPARVCHLQRRAWPDRATSEWRPWWWPLHLCRVLP
jgi:hypothetical protein